MTRQKHQVERVRSRESPSHGISRRRHKVTGQEIINWIEAACHIPEGKLIGQLVQLMDFQKEIITDIYDNPRATTRRAIISMGRKNSKALALDTPVPTPDGWRTIADIQPDDLIFGSDGKPVRVLGVSEIFINKPCRAVGFSDGSSIVTSEDHRWETRHRYRPWESSGVGGRPRMGVVTTKQISESIYVRRFDQTREHNHKLPCSPALHTNPIRLPIPPYILGVWLGNGTTDSSGITAWDRDVDHYVDQLQLVNTDVVVQKNKNRPPTIRLRGRTRKESFQSLLRTTGLLGNKHIPEIYYDSGLAQRWALLQGLMDTDGTVNRCGAGVPRCSFSNTNYQLIYGIWRLARSLGLKASITSANAKLHGRYIGPYWRVEFAAARTVPVFRLARKQELLPKVLLGKRNRTLVITSCKRVESVPTKCLMVDAADKLFLVGHGCIPTHNTALAAFLLLNHLCGPSRKPNSQLYSAAQSRDQASLIFNLAVKMIRMSPELRSAVVIRETAKELICPELGTRYRALSAEATTAFGLNPSFIVHDELGQVRGPRSPLYEALETATGAQEHPLSIVISTQAPTNADLLSVLIDDALAGHDLATICKLYTAAPDLDPFEESTIKLANPAWGGPFLNSSEILSMAEAARRMPAREAEYRNLVLNQRVEVNNPFITQSVWRECGATPSSLDGLPVFGGLDLSSVSDLTALVLMGKRGDVWQVHPTFWLPSEGLREKSQKDRVPYDMWAQQGFLSTTPGNSVSYEYVAHHLKRLFDQYNIVKLGFDRWNFRHLQPWLIQAGFSEYFIKDKFVEFGQGTASMSPALRDLEQAIREKQIAHGNNPVMAMCASCAVVIGADDSNRKLSKGKSSGRIDGLVALAMAFGVCPSAPTFDIHALIG